MIALIAKLAILLIFFIFYFLLYTFYFAIWRGSWCPAKPGRRTSVRQNKEFFLLTSYFILSTFYFLLRRQPFSFPLKPDKIINLIAHLFISDVARPDTLIRVIALVGRFTVNQVFHIA